MLMYSPLVTLVRKEKIKPRNSKSKLGYIIILEIHKQGFIIIMTNAEIERDEIGTYNFIYKVH